MRPWKNGGILAALLLVSSPASGTSVTSGAGSAIRLDGASTLHPYSAETKTFRIDLAVEASAPGDLRSAIRSQAPARMTVTIPVASLKSEHPGLDKNLQKALKADTNPDIVFALETYKAAGSTITVTGDLTIAGRTRTETLDAALSWKEGRVFIDGEQALLMTHFGVKPPIMMMGAVKTADRVVVRFHLELEERKQ